MPEESLSGFVVRRTRIHDVVMEVAVMSFSAREQQALERIGVRLAGSGPKLAAMLATFTRLPTAILLSTVTPHPAGQRTEVKRTGVG
jgi:hypothetical protein